MGPGQKFFCVEFLSVAVVGGFPTRRFSAVLYPFHLEIPDCGLLVCEIERVIGKLSGYNGPYLNP